MGFNIEVKADLTETISKTGDALLTPFTSITQTFSDIWNVVLGDKISFYRQKQLMKYMDSIEQFKLEIETKINKIPANSLSEPDFHIMADAIDNSKHCIDSDELRSMFSSLIANTADSIKAAKIHPSFSYVLKQMCSIDARMLSQLKFNLRYPMVDYVNVYEDGSFKLNQPNVFISPDFSFFDSSIAISSLKRLGIIQIDEQLKLTDDSLYTPYEIEDYFLQMGKSRNLQKYSFCLSSYGMLLKNACLTSR